MLEFIEELIEARMYRGKDTFEGKSAQILAKSAFLMLMLLEILRNEDKPEAKKYATDTIGSDNFSHVKSSATDLRNILVVLSNQDQFSSKIQTDANINVPNLQLKRYLRDIQNSVKQVQADRAFLKTLESFFKISDQSLKNIRRSVADWKDCTSTEKSQTKANIKRQLMQFGQQSDIYRSFFVD